MIDMPTESRALSYRNVLQILKTTGPKTVDELVGLVHTGVGGISYILTVLYECGLVVDAGTASEAVDRQHAIALIDGFTPIGPAAQVKLFAGLKQRKFKITPKGGKHLKDVLVSYPLSKYPIYQTKLVNRNPRPAKKAAE